MSGPDVGDKGMWRMHFPVTEYTQSRLWVFSRHESIETSIKTPSKAPLHGPLAPHHQHGTNWLRRNHFLLLQYELYSSRYIKEVYLYRQANIFHLVSWNWNGSHPSGTASEVNPGEVTVVSHRGNEISKTGDESNPAVHIERSGNDVVKLANELHVDKKSSESNTNGTSSSEPKTDQEEKQDTPQDKVADKKEPEKQAEEKEEEPKAEKKEEETKESNGDAQVGDKRKSDEKADAVIEEKNGEDAAKDVEAKKQKTSNGTAAPTNGEKEKKKPGRPKGNNTKAAKKEKKAPAVGRAERKTRSQGGV
jgi:hypothetical protein